MGGVGFLIIVVIFICVSIKGKSDDRQHRAKNPWKENMTDEERKAWILKESDIVQEEGWKKLGH